MDNKFYVYAYLDPRREGVFTYKDLEFNYEPFYIGKGCNNRKYHHLWEAQGKRASHEFPNNLKLNKIKKILREGFEPLIVLLDSNLEEEDANKLEEDCISKIGLLIRKEGPLTNKALGDPFKGRMVMKGENHPLYNKNHSESTKQKIKDNHADCRGPKNSRSKKWKLTDPSGTVFYVEGTLKQFCEEHNLALGIIKRRRGLGPYTMERFSSTKGLAQSTVGWSSEEII